MEGKGTRGRGGGEQSAGCGLCLPGPSSRPSASPRSGPSAGWAVHTSPCGHVGPLPTRLSPPGRHVCPRPGASRPPADHGSVLGRACRALAEAAGRPLGGGRGGDASGRGPGGGAVTRRPGLTHAGVCGALTATRQSGSLVPNGPPATAGGASLPHPRTSSGPGGGDEGHSLCPLTHPRLGPGPECPLPDVCSDRKTCFQSGGHAPASHVAGVRPNVTALNTTSAPRATVPAVQDA